MKRLSDSQIKALAYMKYPLTPRQTIRELTKALREAYELIDKIDTACNDRDVAFYLKPIKDILDKEIS